MDDVILNKIAIVERCLQRVDEEYLDHKNEFKSNYTKQDSIILNLLRACEATIDMGMRIVKIRGLGVPQSSKEVFSLLESAEIIPSSLSKQLQAMTGFRNIAIHNYKKLDLEIVQNILDEKLPIFFEFNKISLKFT